MPDTRLPDPSPEREVFSFCKSRMQKNAENCISLIDKDFQKEVRKTIETQ